MIRVLTHFTPSWKEIAAITVPVMQRYCDRHHYIFNAYRCTPYENYNGKEKIRHILSDLKEGDVAMVMDADCLITNLNISLHNFIDDTHDFYITKHVGNINAGVFIVRKTEWLIKFLDYVFENIGKENIHCEQDAFAKWIKEHPHDKKIKIVNHPAFNSLKYELYPEHGIQEEKDGQWVEGESFILHLPGVGMQRRIEFFKNTTITE